MCEFFTWRPAETKLKKVMKYKQQGHVMCFAFSFNVIIAACAQIKSFVVYCRLPPLVPALATSRDADFEDMINVHAQVSAT